MRNVTWLVRWQRWSRRPLTLALLLAWGYTPASGGTDEPEKQPAPVLKVTRQQPELGRPAAPSPQAQRSERTGTTGNEAPQATSARRRASAAGSVAPDVSQPQGAASAPPASADGWKPRRGTPLSSTSLTAGELSASDAEQPPIGSGLAMRRRDAKPTAPGSGPVGPAADSPEEPTEVAAAIDPPSLRGPVVSPIATPGARADGNGGLNGASEPAEGVVSEPADENRKWRPVPRMRPPSGKRSNVEAEPDSGNETVTQPQASPAAPGRSSGRGGGAELGEQTTNAPADTARAAKPDNTLAGPQRDGESADVSRELPIRRPRIDTRRLELPRGAQSGRSGRSRALQEQLERFERQPVAEDPVAADLYDNPSLAAEDEQDAAAEASDTAGVPAGEPTAEEPAPVISAAALQLKEPIERTLQYYYRRPENARQRTPWGMLHAILPYGQDAQISTGRRRFNAIAWLAGNNPGRNLRILTTSRSGHLVARSGVGLQGHQGQLLAIFAQIGVPGEYPLHANGRKFNVADLVRAEMAACKDGEELTFTLIGLSHYLPTDSRWRTPDGQEWDFERLIREELSQPVVGAACGGTHRLMGFSYALNQRRLEGLPIDGQWRRAEIFINDFVAYAWSLQNRDGSFSTNWFEGPADDGRLDRKLQTSGHILEWLLFTASRDELQDPRVTRAVKFLTNALSTNPRHGWEVGPKGHALRALSLYHRRVFGSARPWLPGAGEASPVSRRARR